MGLVSSSLMYVTSDYIQESAGEGAVGIFYVIAYLAVFVLLLYFHKIVRSFGKIRVFLMIQFLKILILSALSIVPAQFPGAVLILGYMVFSYMTWVEMDSILETFSIDRMSGRIRGVYLFFSNLGYFSGPFIATRLLGDFGFFSVFIFTMILSMMLFVFTLIKFRNIKEEIREFPAPRKLFKKVFANKDVFNIYLVSIALEIFFALAVVYLPLHLLSLGLDWSQVGVVIAFSMIPFLVLQYPAGLLADKKLGEKELLFIATVLTGISAMMIYFIDSSSVVFWSLIMLLIRIGPAIMEILRDSYFYKKIDGTDLDMIDFFRTAGPVGIISGTLIATFSLLFFPMKMIFLLSGLLIMLGMFPIIKLHDNFSEEEVSNGKGEIKLRARLGFLKVLGKRMMVGKMR